MSIEDCHLIEFPEFRSDKGNLSFIEGMNHIPFEIKRVYYIYDVPEVVQRGAHGHKKLQQIIIAIGGSLDFTVHDGKNSKTYTLNNASCGLYVAPMIWRDLTNFQANTVCLVLASELYDENDYFRDYDQYLANCAFNGQKTLI